MFRTIDQYGGGTVTDPVPISALLAKAHGEIPYTDTAVDGDEDDHEPVRRPRSTVPSVLISVDDEEGVDVTIAQRHVERRADEGGHGQRVRVGYVDAELLA